MTAILLGLLAALAWGSADFAARFTGRALGAATAAFGVLAAGALVLTAILVANGTPLPAAPSPWALAYGLSAAAGTLALYEALRRGAVTVVVPLAGAFPAWALALLVVFEGLRPSAAAWAAMATVMAGVWIVARFANNHDQESPAGTGAIVLALASGLGFAIALVVGPHAAAAHGDLTALWLARLSGAIAVLPLAMLAGRNRPRPPPRWLAVVAVQGILDTLAYLALLLAGKGGGAAEAAVIGSAFGIVAIALARLVLKEVVAPRQWLGIALTFAGIAALTALS